MSPSTPQHAKPLATGLGCPTTLAAAIAAGAPIILQARTSNASGNASFAAAVKNLITLVRALVANDVFPHLTDFIPTTQELVRRLKDECDPVKSVDKDGQPFENRFLTLRVADQVYLHVSCGSGRKVDHETMHQPVALHAAAFIRDIKPAVVCAAEVSRWSRNPWSLFPWAEAVESLEDAFGHAAFLSLDGDRPKPFTASTQQELFERITQAGAEARDMKNRTTKAVDGMLPVQDMGGYCRYPFSQAPPPPLAIAWLRDDEAGPRGRQIAFVDTPAVRAALKGRIVYGMPEVADAKGAPIDQLALVRFYLAHRGRPDWPRKRLVQHLVTHGYSTQGLRRQHKSATRDWRGRTLKKSQVQRLVDGIEKHLEFYRSGTLHRRIGDKRGPREAFTLLPPDGEPYVSEADYDRIVTFLGERTEAAHRARRYTFGHHPVTSNGEAGVLIADTSDDGNVIYRVRRTSATGTSDRQNHETLGGKVPAPRMPAHAFALSLVDALCDHGDSLRAFVRTPDPQFSRATDDVLQMQVTLERKTKAKDWTFDLIKSGGGDYSMSGRAIRDLSIQYEDLCLEVEALDRDLAQAVAALARERRKRDPRTISVTQLLEVVRSLRDPEDIEYHAQWRHTIRSLVVDSRYTVLEGVHVRQTRWTGELLVHKGDDERLLPFAGTSSIPTGRHQGSQAVIDDLRRGITTRLRTTYWTKTDGRNRLCDALGIERGAPAPALTIRDPRLLRIAMAIVYPSCSPAPVSAPVSMSTSPERAALASAVAAPLTPRQLPAAARRLNEPLDLVRRVAAVTPAQGHVPGTTRKWQTEGDRAVADLCALAARRRGRLTIGDFERRRWEDLRHAAMRCGPQLFELSWGQIQMVPCPWSSCGSFRRGYLNIREATEPVCWACRRDISGIDWPTRYDRYRTKGSE